MTRRTLKDCRIIVTGASSGIGAALVRQLVRLGARVVVTARREDRLRSLASELNMGPGQLCVVVGDVTRPATRQQCLQVVRQQWGGLDLLINNAGAGALGPFAQSSSDRLRQIFELDFFSAVEFTREAIPLLLAGKNPMIVNVGSVLGHRAVPGKSEYCAAKFALHGFSDALRAELAGQGIDLLLASPSTTRSEFFHQLLGGDGSQEAQRPGMTPDQVATRIIHAMEQGKHEVILSVGGKLLVWADRLCPVMVNRLLAWHFRRTSRGE